MPRPRRTTVLAVLGLAGALLAGTGPATAAPATAAPATAAPAGATPGTAAPASTPAPFSPASGLPRPGTPAPPARPATAGGGPTAAPAPRATPAATAASTTPGGFTALPPARVLDTRDGTGVPAGRVQPSGTVTVRVAGRGGVPASGAAAVVLTLTATSVTSGGFVTAYPAGGTAPVVSNLNVRPGVTVANLVTVPLGTNGAVSFRSGAFAPVDLIADVSGWYRAGTATAAGTFTALPPTRIVDSRTGKGTTATPWAAGENRTVAVAGHGGVPATGARSVVLNVTVVAPGAAGYLTASPSGTPLPATSNLNFGTGQIAPGQVTVPLGADGGVALYLGSTAPADVVVDVQGWTRSGPVLAAGAFRGVAPARLLDTRQDPTDEYGFSAVPSGGVITVPVAHGVPAHAITAALLNVTVTGTQTAGYVTAFPAGGTTPHASNLNFLAGDTVPDAVAVAVGSDGSVALYNGSGGTVELVVDVAGYWLDGSLGAASGTVTGPSGTPLAGAQVAVAATPYDWDGLRRSAFDPDAVTDAAGHWTADALDPATGQTLCVSTTTATPVPAGGLVGACPQSGTVTVLAGRTVSVDAQLTQTGQAFSGRLVGAGGEALAGVPVHLGSRGASAGPWSQPVVTGPDGTWRAPGIDPSVGNADVCLDGAGPTGRAPQGYPAQCIPSVSNGATDVADAGTAVSGRVTDASGHPLAHVAVTWGLGYGPNGNGTQLMTGPDGTYRLVVDPGTQGEALQVCFQARHWYDQPIVPSGGSSTTGYQDQCWRGQPFSYTTTDGSYTAIPLVAGGSVTGIDAALAPAAALSGQVRGPGGTPVAGVNVVLYGTGDLSTIYVRTLTGSDGRYRLTAQLPGGYTVCFVPTLGSPLPPPTGLLPQCWHETTPFTQGVVTLTAGTETTGVDADLNAGGTLTGRITDAAGDPLTGAAVSIDDGQSMTTGTDGVYRFTYVRALPMRIVVRADGASGGSSPAGYLDTCVGCDTDPLHRSPVPVAVGRTTTYDVPLVAASGIRAHVTDAAGAPVTGAQVDVTPVGGSGGVAYPSGTDGTVVVPRLAPGSYTVCVGDGHGATGGSSAGGWLQTCYPPAPASSTVTVAVPAATTVEVTVHPIPGAGVAGRITDPSGRLVHNASVQVFGTSVPQDSALVYSAADGRFSALGLTPGTYSVCATGGTVDGTTEQLGSMCWKDQPNAGGSSPTPVTLKAGALTSGIDQALPLQ